MTVIPNSYSELIAHASNYSNITKPNVSDLLKHLGFQGASLHAQAPIFYVVDYTSRKYLYIDPSCEKVLGYDLEFLSDAGPVYFTGLWNKNDFKIYNENIIPEALSFLKTQPVSSYPDFSCTCNYRLKTRSGNELTFLQRSTFFLSSEKGDPLAAVGFIVDISYYKTDTSIIHTIEKVDRNFSSISKTPVFKSVHYPDRVGSILSKRELDILVGIFEGLSSKEIADNLCISINTVNNHRKNMLKKTNTFNVSELLKYGQNNGLL